MCKLVTNHFKMSIRNQGLIHIFKVDFGMLEEEYHMQALKNGQKSIAACVGIHMICPGDRDDRQRLIFAMQQPEEPIFTVIASANG